MVEEAFPFIQGMGVTILDSEGEVLGTGPGPPTFVANISPPRESATYSDGGGFTITEGSYPQGRDQVALDRGTAEQGGFEIGESVTVISDLAGRLQLTLAGIAVFGADDSLGGTKWVFFDLPTTQAVLQRPGKLSGGSVQVTPGTPVEDVIPRIQAVLPENATVVSGQDAAEEEAAEIQAALSFFTVFLSVFGWVALFVGSFLIYNTFRIVVSQRTKELALLRALGAGGRQVRGDSPSRGADDRWHRRSARDRLRSDDRLRSPADTDRSWYRLADGFFVHQTSHRDSRLGCRAGGHPCVSPGTRLARLEGFCHGSPPGGCRQPTEDRFPCAVRSSAPLYPESGLRHSSSDSTATPARGPAPSPTWEPERR